LADFYKQFVAAFWWTNYTADTSERQTHLRLLALNLAQFGAKIAWNKH